MTKVIVLGAKGRFGRAAVTAFSQAGWEVTAFGRNWSDAPVDGVTRVTGDALDPEVLSLACEGQDVIINAINPPYEDWAEKLPRITQSVIQAAQESGAHVLVPGNIYNYGADAPALLSETTPWHPTTRKGKLRVEMEQSYRAAGVPTIVLRSGDFFEREISGSWFESYIAVQARKGRTMYPGPLDQIHAWAYLPDMGRLAVLLAERRDSFGQFEEFGFDGYTLTGANLVKCIGRATGKRQKVSGLPWWIVRVLGVFRPAMRELVELRYLWNVPHRVDGNKLYRMVPEFKATPMDQAFKEVLAA